VVGWLFIAYALPRLPAVETSFLLLLQPMATVLWASIIFAEDLSGLQWLGVILVVSGISLPSLSLRTGTADG
jgi:drug/metabolite transporter (DMT)-like permease